MRPPTPQKKPGEQWELTSLARFRFVWMLDSLTKVFLFVVLNWSTFFGATRPSQDYKIWLDLNWSKLTRFYRGTTWLNIMCWHHLHRGPVAENRIPAVGGNTTAGFLTKPVIGMPKNVGTMSKEIRPRFPPWLISVDSHSAMFAEESATLASWLDHLPLNKKWC